MTESIVRNQYNQVANRYDRRWSGYLRKTLIFLASWAQISSSATVLDIACGTGEFERLLLNHNPKQEIVGTDISEQMLRQAGQKLSRYPNLSFHNAPAADLPLSNNSVDVIVCASSFHYFDNSAAALAEMKRVLKPEGRVVILDWCRDYLVCKICDWFLKLSDRAHQKCYTQAEFHALLRDAGFVVRRATKFRFGVVWGVMAAEAVCRGQWTMDNEQLTKN